MLVVLMWLPSSKCWKCFVLFELYAHWECFEQSGKIDMFLLLNLVLHYSFIFIFSNSFGGGYKDFSNLNALNKVGIQDISKTSISTVFNYMIFLFFIRFLKNLQVIMTTILKSFRALSTIVLLQGLFLCIFSSCFLVIFKGSCIFSCWEMHLA